MTNHISASQRQIRSLQSRVAELELMQHEYNALLNYLVVVHGGDDQTFVIETAKMKPIKFLPIKTEIVDNGKRMLVRRLTGTEEKSLIILE